MELQKPICNKAYTKIKNHQRANKVNQALLLLIEKQNTDVEICWLKQRQSCIVVICQCIDYLLIVPKISEYKIDV